MRWLIWGKGNREVAHHPLVADWLCGKPHSDQAGEWRAQGTRVIQETKINVIVTSVFTWVMGSRMVGCTARAVPNQGAPRPLVSETYSVPLL